MSIEIRIVLIIIIIISNVQLVSLKPIVVYNNETTPMSVSITCRPGQYIRRDCKFYVDCYRGHWRRNFCSTDKYWNHVIKKCDDLHNVPECLEQFLDMQHSPLNSNLNSNLKSQQIDSQNKSSQKTSSKHLSKSQKAQQNFITEELSTVGEKTEELSTVGKKTQELTTKPSEISTLMPNSSNVSDHNLKPSYNLFNDNSCSNGYTFRIEFKIHNNVLNAFKVLFYYIYLIIVYLK
jgi:hypothetical protein